MVLMLLIIEVDLHTMEIPMLTIIPTGGALRARIFTMVLMLLIIEVDLHTMEIPMLTIIPTALSGHGQ